MPENKLSQEEMEQGIRQAFEDTIRVSETLGVHCQSIDQLVGMLKLALENDGQLRLLLKSMASVKK